MFLLRRPFHRLRRFRQPLRPRVEEVRSADSGFRQRYPD
jgi:hypothetical protein